MIPYGTGKNNGILNLLYFVHKVDFDFQIYFNSGINELK